jgi:hypothetical protein
MAVSERMIDLGRPNVAAPQIRPVARAARRRDPDARLAWTPWLQNLGALAATALVSYGAWLAWPPGGFITGGVLRSVMVIFSITSSE